MIVLTAWSRLRPVEPENAARLVAEFVTVFWPFAVDTALVTADQVDKSEDDCRTRLESVFGQEQTRLVPLVGVLMAGGVRTQE